MSKNYMMIDDNKIDISDKTAKNLKEQFAPTTYRMGDKFTLTSQWGTKCKVRLVQTHKLVIMLIAIPEGNRYYDTEVTVKNCMKITTREVDKLMNNSKYEKIEE